MTAANKQISLRDLFRDVDDQRQLLLPARIVVVDLQRRLETDPFRGAFVIHFGAAAVAVAALS